MRAGDLRHKNANTQFGKSSNRNHEEFLNVQPFQDLNSLLGSEIVHMPSSAHSNLFDLECGAHDCQYLSHG